MSKKILIDEAILIRAISAMGLCFEFLSNLGSVFANDIDLAMHDLKKAIEEAKGKHYGVLDWHPVSEKPEKGRIILVRHKDNSVPFDVYKVGAFELDCMDYPYINVKEWAYLLE